MEIMNPKFEGAEGGGQSLTSEDQIVGNGNDSKSSEREEAPKGAFDHEEALWELRKTTLKDPVYDMDGSEVQRISELVDHSDSRDAFLFLKAAETTNALKEGSFEESALNFTEEASELLEKIGSRTKSYLVKSWINSVLESPEKDWTLEQKEDFLREYFIRGAVLSYIETEHLDEWGKYLWNIRQGNLLNIPERDKEKIFNSFLRNRLAIFNHVRRRGMYERFHVPELSKKYWLPLPSIPEGYAQEIPSEIGRIVGKASREYGIVYNPQFAVEYFFHRDARLENQESKETTKIISQKMTAEDMLREEGFSGSQEEIQKLSELYRILIEPFFRSKIEDEFLLRLDDFSVRTQVQFLNFLFKKNEEEVARVRKFLRSEIHFGNYPFGPKSRGADLVRQGVRDNFLDVAREERKNRLTSFLSLEQGGADMGEKILAIGEKLPKEAADRVFAKYAEMADRAGEARKNSEKDADAIEAKLLERGKSFLSWIAEYAEEFAHDEKLLSALSERLENLNAETILTVNALRAMKESENTEGIKEFLDGSFRILKGSDLSSKMKTEMESLYRMSYPSDREEKFRETLVRNLYEQKIPDPNARFYTFFVGESGKKSLKAFCSFQDKVDEETKTRFVYFGAFNVDEFFSGEKMGCLMMDESLEREAKEHVVRGDCIPEKPISEHYIEKRGFVGKSFSDLEEIDLLAIERDDKNAGHYETKRMTQEDVIRKSEAGFKDTFRIFLSVSGRSLSRESIEANLKDGFALTRMFRRGEGEGAKVYLAFEK